MRFIRRHKVLTTAVLLSLIAAVGIAIRFVTAFADVPFVISKETTYITEPLRPDGQPDYLAVMNAWISRGVTPKNNAAVLFWQAVGPSSIRKRSREEFFNMLDVPEPAKSGEYFVELSAYPAWRKSTLPGEKPQFDAKRDLSSAISRPWSKQEFPIIAAWLAANEKPLALLVRASKQSCYYDPLVSEEKEAVCYGVGNHAHREVSAAFLARAMLRIREGKIDDAWQDLLACHRLARLRSQCQASSGYTWLVLSNELFAIKCEQVLLRHAKLSPSQIAAMRNDLARLPPEPSFVEKMDFGDRCKCLKTILWLAQRNPLNVRSLVTPKTTPVVASKAGIDWNMVLRSVNAWYDGMAAASREPSPAKQRTAERRVVDDLHDEVAIARSWTTSLSSLVNPRDVHSKAVALSFVDIDAIPRKGFEDRLAIQRILNEVVFALSAHHADHGAYPTRLNELEPAYLKELPKDIFADDAELHYEKKSDGYMLYSVGVNGKDDSGKGKDDAKNGEGWDDITIRMTAASR